MNDLAASVVATVATACAAHRQHGNPREQAVLPVLPVVAAENGYEAQHNALELDALIEAAAEVWGYDGDDLRRINEVARADPDGMRLALSADPMVRLHLRARLGPEVPR